MAEGRIAAHTDLWDIGATQEELDTPAHGSSEKPKRHLAKISVDDDEGSVRLAVCVFLSPYEDAAITLHIPLDYIEAEMLIAALRAALDRNID